MASGGNKSALISAEWKEWQWKDVVVSTIAGDGESTSTDGVGTKAGLYHPFAMIKSADGKSLVFTETGSQRIRCHNFDDGRVSTLLFGAGVQNALLFAAEGFKTGHSKNAGFRYPYALCTDPLKPNNLFIGDTSSIRYWDSATDQVTLIAGDGEGGYADGVGSNARFFGITGLLCHPNGKRCTCRTE